MHPVAKIVYRGARLECSAQWAVADHDQMPTFIERPKCVEEYDLVFYRIEPPHGAEHVGRVGNGKFLPEIDASSSTHESVEIDAVLHKRDAAIGSSHPAAIKFNRVFGAADIYVCEIRSKQHHREVDFVQRVLNAMQRMNDPSRCSQSCGTRGFRRHAAMTVHDIKVTLAQVASQLRRPQYAADTRCGHNLNRNLRRTNQRFQRSDFFGTHNLNVVPALSQFSGEGKNKNLHTTDIHCRNDHGDSQRRRRNCGARSGTFDTGSSEADGDASTVCTHRRESTLCSGERPCAVSVLAASEQVATSAKSPQK